MQVISIILAILAFGVLVIVHEFGHFITAKRGGVQVNEFWIGMGPTILKYEYHGTMYCLKLLPVGGACVSEKHAGFIVNRGGATCADVRALIGEVQRRVQERAGVLLEPEVKFVEK